MNYEDDVFGHLFRIALVIVVVTVAVQAIATLGNADGFDVNLDGTFTFSDIGRAALIAYCAPGTWLLTALPTLAEFMEYNWYQGLGWQSVLLATFSWMVAILGISWALFHLLSMIAGRPSSKP